MNFEGALAIGFPDVCICGFSSNSEELIWVNIFFCGCHVIWASGGRSSKDQLNDNAVPLEMLTPVALIMIECLYLESAVVRW